MNDSASRHTDRARGPTVVIVVDDPTQLPADLAPLVGHLQHLTWPNGPPSIQIVAGKTCQRTPGSPFIERRKRMSDRRQYTRLVAPDADDATNTEPGTPPRCRVRPPLTDGTPAPTGNGRSSTAGVE